MKTLKRISAFCLLGIVFFTVQSCKNYENESSIFDQSIVEINYGTSFGMCGGYCINGLTLTSGNQTFKSTSWNDSLEPKKYSAKFSAEKWQLINSKIDAAAFFKLAPVFGCPDCADGGAEWVEIELKSGEKHKVMYEYSKEPEELKTVVALLRAQFNEIIDANK